MISLGRDRAIFFLRTGNLRPIDQSRHKLIDTLRLHPRCRTIFKDRAGVGLLQRPRREHQARIERRGLVKPVVAGMGIGPILGIGENNKVPTR